MKVLFVYDDTVSKSELIYDIIGNKGYADVIVKRKRIEEYYREALSSLSFDFEWINVKSFFEFNDFANTVSLPRYEGFRVCHCFSNFFFIDSDSAKLSIEKIKFIKETYKVMSDDVAMMMFENTEDYRNYLLNVCRADNSLKAAREYKKEFSIQGLLNISHLDNFIQIISGNFDSRYFNSIKGDKYTLTKTSVNKAKIKSEYYYYQLLPESMKRWMVIPFDYRETDTEACYSMERLHMTDLSIKWVHGSIDTEEFSVIMDKYFYFFNSRCEKAVSENEYRAISESLYTDKVIKRNDIFAKSDIYKKINNMLKATNGISVNDITERYFLLKKRIESRCKFRYVSAIGHGDPCFANTMYNKSTQMLKFIDPKGAVTEDELWTNPYYDLAKLSHSVCGRYDFFNNALFEIKIDDEFHTLLTIDFDNSAYKEIFRKKLAENGYDYLAVRVYEASLFLSMLPLHIDYPHKVFGFVLNAIDILDEIESELNR